MRDKIRKITAWILLIVMGIHSFGNMIPSSISTAYATDFPYSCIESKIIEEYNNSMQEVEGISENPMDNAKNSEETTFSKDTVETVETEIPSEEKVLSEDILEKNQKVDPVQIFTAQGGQGSGSEQMDENEPEVFADMTISTKTTLSEDMEAGNHIRVKFM